MGKYERSLKNIYKQYGKNIKAWDDKEKNAVVPQEIEKMYEKYGFDLSARKPFISVRHWRWGNCIPKERQVDTFEKLEKIAMGN
jgi:hypothetical protein